MNAPQGHPKSTAVSPVTLHTGSSFVYIISLLLSLSWPFAIAIVIVTVIVTRVQSSRYKNSEWNFQHFSRHHEQRWNGQGTGHISLTALSETITLLTVTFICQSKRSKQSEYLGLKTYHSCKSLYIHLKLRHKTYLLDVLAIVFHTRKGKQYTI